jgi:hypothetical protein
VRKALDTLVDRSLMYAEGNSYLSLAIPLGDGYELTQAKAERLAEAIAASDDASAACAYLGVDLAAARTIPVHHPSQPDERSDREE